MIVQGLCSRPRYSAGTSNWCFSFLFSHTRAGGVRSLHLSASRQQPTSFRQSTPKSWPASQSTGIPMNPSPSSGALVGSQAVLRRHPSCGSCCASPVTFSKRFRIAASTRIVSTTRMLYTMEREYRYWQLLETSVDSGRLKEQMSSTRTCWTTTSPSSMRSFSASSPSKPIR